MAKEKETQKEKKPFNWKKAVAIGAIVLTVFSVAAVAVGCNTNTMHQGGNNPGFSQDGGNNGGVVDPDINQGGNGGQDDPVITPGPGGNGGQDDPIVTPPPVVEITEAEYKEMFETNILAAIENDFNEDIAMEKYQIKDLALELINYETGDVYFTCERNNQKLMYIANHEEIADWATYEALNENFPMDEFTYSPAYTVQEDALAQEIVEFALTQTAIQDYIDEHNLDFSDYEIINATEFVGSAAGRSSTVILKSGDDILTFNIGGATGACRTQEEYVNKMKNLSKVYIENIGHSEHYEIPTGTAESSADYGFEF